MLRGGTARKRATIAGTAAVVTGVATATIGLLATPAVADSAPITYNCSTKILGQPVANFVLTTTVRGAVGAAPQVGGAVTLGGFQVNGSTNGGLASVLATLGVTQVSGSFTSFPVTATQGDGGVDKTVDAAGPLPEFTFTGDVNAGMLSFTTGPVDLTGFTAHVPGPMVFSAGPIIAAQVTLSGPTDIKIVTTTVNCNNGGGQVTSVDVPAPPTTTPTSPGTGEQGDGGDDDEGGQTQQSKSAPAGAGSESSATATPQRMVADQRTLANTGAPYTLPMTAIGAALLLFGVGMLVFARRFRTATVEGAPTED